MTNYILSVGYNLRNFIVKSDRPRGAKATSAMRLHGESRVGTATVRRSPFASTASSKGALRRKPHRARQRRVALRGERCASGGEKT